MTFPSSVDLSICFLGRLGLSLQRGLPLLATDLCDAEPCSRSRVALTMKASECQPFQDEQKSKLKLNIMHKYVVANFRIYVHMYDAFQYDISVILLTTKQIYASS